MKMVSAPRTSCKYRNEKLIVNDTKTSTKKQTNKEPNKQKNCRAEQLCSNHAHTF